MVKGGFQRSVAASAFVLAVVLVGCAGPPRSTRMTVDDLDAISGAMAASLAASPALAGRGPSSSPAWVISIDKVENLSSDVMTESEQWAVVARIRGSLAIQALREQKNVRFVIPPDRVEAMRSTVGSAGDQPGWGAHRRPTHQMAATFRSVTRAGATDRTELYYCEFQVVDLSSGERVWSDRFEYKRIAKGHVWD